LVERWKERQEMDGGMMAGVGRKMEGAGEVGWNWMWEIKKPA